MATAFSVRFEGCRQRRHELARARTATATAKQLQRQKQISPLRRKCAAFGRNDDFKVLGEKTNKNKQRRAAISVSNGDDGGLLFSRALLFSFSLKTPPF
jgi:hypothetical protein